MDDLDEPVEFLVTRRSRRSTAGNRMEAALAEMALDDTAKDLEDDVDFTNERDEEDIFESDFESTDDEAAQAVEAAGEKEVEDEERRARRTARSKLEKATAAAHAKHKVTFNPQATYSVVRAKPKPTTRRQVSLGTAVETETGEVLSESKAVRERKRHSKRVHTVQNTSATAIRMKESEQKKASAPKKSKSETKTYTQAELIALALDNEEGNIVEHRDYLKIEEEKRKRARVVRATVEGPLVRWVSRKEEVTILVEPPPPPSPPKIPVPPSPITFPGSYNSLSFKHANPVSRWDPSILPVSMSGINVTNPSTSSTIIPTIPTTNVAPSTSSSTSTSPPTKNTPNVINIQPAVTALTSPFAVWPPPPPLTSLIPNIDPQLQLQNAVTSLASSHSCTSFPQQNATFTPPLINSTHPVSQSPTTSTQLGTQPTTAFPPPLTNFTPPISSHTTSTQPGSQSTTIVADTTQPTTSAPPVTYATTNFIAPFSQSSSTNLSFDFRPASTDSLVSSTPFPPPVYRTEIVTKNYVVHELGQKHGTAKPAWKDTMQAMFGDHIKWDELKVYTSKSRPMSRPIQICPITGMEAPYRDPRTGVPFSNVEAYEVLTRLIEHEYIWSPELGCYIGRKDGIGGDAMDVDSST